MQTLPVRIVDVHRTPTRFRIEDEHGVRYATANEWLASLCQRAIDTERKAVLTHHSGWYYRNLEDVTLVEEDTP